MLMSVRQVRTMALLFAKRIKRSHIVTAASLWLLALLTYKCYTLISIRPPQVTYLTMGAPPVKDQTFPYVYLPAPKEDMRKVHFITGDIHNLEVVIRALLTEHPTWKTKNWCSMQRQKIIHRFGLSAKTLRLIYEYLSYTVTPPNLINFAEILQQLSILKQRQFPKEQRKLTCDNCFPYDFKNLISPKDVCKGDDNVLGVIMVTTIPKNIKERRVVRNTWGRDALTRNFKLVFLFGAGWPEDQVKLLEAEAKEHNDILMDDFVDNYYNLTQKVLMGFKWMLRACPQAKFAVRSADDTTINIPELITLISKHGQSEAFQKHQVGHCLEAYIPHRSLDFKGYLSTFEYDQDVFPPYALGSVFLVSNRLMRELVETSPNVPFIAIEDSYFGLALAQLGRGCHHVEGMIGHYTTHEEKTFAPEEHFIRDVFID